MNTQRFFDLIATLAGFEIPVPDLALVLIAIVLIVLVRMTSINKQRDAVNQVADLYVNELARANRQCHAAESKLASAKSDLEKLRRRSRS